MSSRKEKAGSSGGSLRTSRQPSQVGWTRERWVRDYERDGEGKVGPDHVERYWSRLSSLDTQNKLHGVAEIGRHVGRLCATRRVQAGRGIPLRQLSMTLPSAEQTRLT
ncbi:hypothetical protein F441_18176 [Phytophthora nicotianae CJ01A1]|uniref:Uncharacterized protein n=3 Tax=Phytophthora nicotianae TaxID=4792 RepID=W2PN00_PHYN3|nr:hypothetical protein PPTG_24017 [Phytophthora nicotianae INRA-310]ETK75600.1 hypothetical protein L915_17822 [Phytophthora nicotianae]ETL29032.1 hypothetical protein L916_17723 [Phytophthora nicotianae]ETN01634.1 hypothetical protein PPTG_24017 [Phytophthora nicotianae INRA-310]ETP05182.1 hypothetical protein F441_18176 [Phytophthora nicotianae CJ01A1]